MLLAVVVGMSGALVVDGALRGTARGVAHAGGIRLPEREKGGMQLDMLRWWSDAGEPANREELRWCLGRCWR